MFGSHRLRENPFSTAELLDTRETWGASRGKTALMVTDILLMARTRLGELRHTFHVSRLTRYDLRMLADFFSILLMPAFQPIDRSGDLDSSLFEPKAVETEKALNGLIRALRDNL